MFAFLKKSKKFIFGPNKVKRALLLSTKKHEFVLNEEVDVQSHVFFSSQVNKAKINLASFLTEKFLVVYGPFKN